MNMKKVFSAAGAFGVAALAMACVALLSPAAQAQNLTPFANPPSGLAGVNNSYVAGSGFPSGAITGATAHFGTSCAAPAVASAAVTQVSSVGPIDRFQFPIPSTLTTGTYQVWVSGTAGSTPFNTLNTPSCSQISVTVTTPTLAACVPTSSLAVVAGTNVTAYIALGAWGGYGVTGIAAVPLEGSGTAMTFTTTDLVNSCAANSVTGEVVCTENNTNVDLINGSTLTTITSGANTFAVFSGGSCENCGVAINAVNNTAVLEIGLLGGGAGESGGSSGLQVLNLATNTFNTPFPLAHYVSEEISIDPSHNLILSPAETGVYDLLQIGAGNTLTEFGNNVNSILVTSELDSAAEDCTTGIAMASDEFSDGIYITDLTQAKFTSGSPGTWTAPQQFFQLNDGGYSAGTSGISSAPGSNHLAVVTGEFGGQSYAALLLPSTSGSGVPTLADYAYVATMPPTPDGNSFSAGFDPHTITAYTSPNTSKSYAVLSDWFPGYPDFLAVIDLACVLAQPRTAGTHNVIGNASACTRYVAVP